MHACRYRFRLDRIFIKRRETGLDVSSMSSTSMCMNCGVLQTESRPLLNCSACKGGSKYCGAQCQKAHWPMHREICKQIVTATANNKQGLKEMSAVEQSLFATEKQWKSWTTGCSQSLTCLTHRVLDGRQGTHVAIISVVVRPDQLPVFTVVSARAMTDLEWAQEKGYEGLLERIQANRKQMVPPTGSPVSFGLAFFDDGGVKPWWGEALVG